MIGAVALYFELSAPGIGLGGLIAGLCFTLFFWSRFLGGTAGWLEVILVLAGAAFLAVEIFVLPGFGIAGITGLAADRRPGSSWRVRITCFRRALARWLIWAGRSPSCSGRRLLSVVGCGRA